MAAPDKLVPSLLAAQAPANVVEAPASPAAFALSRFEFEIGKGNEGTKILMVEWDTSISGTAKKPTTGAAPPSSPHPRQEQSAHDSLSDWEVSWEGKTTVLPQLDSDAETATGQTRRVYFLLPPGAAIPSLVTISQPRRGGGRPVLRTKPMPAIFAGLVGGGGDETVAAGTRGVLHTLWARRRLGALAAEIEAEMRTNGESVGLEMALQERQWIMDHFGLDADGAVVTPGQGASQGGLQGMPPRLDMQIPPTPQSPASPRSPMGGRLSERLKGLKLATSPSELAAALQASQSKSNSDVAVSSFAMFPGRAPPPPATPPTATTASTKKTAPAAEGKGQGEHDTEEDLFALPMSPRSPEMKKSPFSLL